MRVRLLWISTLAALAAGTACSGKGPSQPENPLSGDYVRFTPPTLNLSGPGQQGTITATGDESNGSPIKPGDFDITSYYSDSPYIAVLSTAPAAGGFSVTIKGVAVGYDRLVLSPPPTAPLRNPTVQTADVYVYPAGTWSGSVSLATTSCMPPGQGAYNETLVIAINGSGGDTATAQDTPGFNRTYSILFAQDWLINKATATATGTFSWLGTPVGGSVAIDRVDGTHIKYTETTTYPCSATYTGTLTLQG